METGLITIGETCVGLLRARINKIASVTVRITKESDIH